MQALKVLVAIMGLMILAGLALLVATVVGRMAHRAAPPTAAGAPFTAAPIELPTGARIETMGVGTDRLVVDLLLPDGSRQLLVIDLASGRRLGAIPLHAAP